MTDKDAQAIRALIARYSFHDVLMELVRVAAGYSRTSYKWNVVFQKLKAARLVVITPESTYEDCDTGGT